MRTLCLLISAIVLLTVSSRAQTETRRFDAGLIGGLTGSQISGDNLSGFNQIGLTFGPYVETWFNETWGGEFEMIYVMKGSRRVPKAEEGNLSYTLRLNYIEVPLLAKARLKKFTYEMGPTIGFLIGSREMVNELSLPNPRSFDRIEIAALVGVGYDLSDKFAFTVRLGNSLLPVRNHPAGSTFRWNLGQYNAVLSFLFRYRF